MQLLYLYNLASLYLALSLGIPFGPEFVTAKTAHLFTGLLAAFTLDVAAFSAEIVRGGILSGRCCASAGWLRFRQLPRDKSATGLTE